MWNCCMKAGTGSGPSSIETPTTWNPRSPYFCCKSTKCGISCRQEIPHFVDLQQKYGDRGFQVVGVSMDDGPEPVPAFMQQFHMNYPVVMGNAKTGELYGGLLGLPITFVLDREGRIVAKHVGATDAAVFEKEIVKLLGADNSASGF